MIFKVKAQKRSSLIIASKCDYTGQQISFINARLHVGIRRGFIRVYDSVKLRLSIESVIMVVQPVLR